MSNALSIESFLNNSRSNENYSQYNIKGLEGFNRVLNDNNKAHGVKYHMSAAERFLASAESTMMGLDLHIINRSKFFDTRSKLVQAKASESVLSVFDETMGRSVESAGEFMKKAWEAIKKFFKKLGMMIAHIAKVIQNFVRGKVAQAQNKFFKNKYRDLNGVIKAIQADKETKVKTKYDPEKAVQDADRTFEETHKNLTNFAGEVSSCWSKIESSFSHDGQNAYGPDKVQSHINNLLVAAAAFSSDSKLARAKVDADKSKKSVGHEFTKAIKSQFGISNDSAERLASNVMARAGKLLDSVYLNKMISMAKTITDNSKIISSVVNKIDKMSKADDSADKKINRKNQVKHIKMFGDLAKAVPVIAQISLGCVFTCRAAAYAAAQKLHAKHCK
ncbi:MAG: hypothetical protein R3Y24_14105 [Eubacteriales bacterium]